ncbi:uncharacterized protein LOC129614422 [Condylostylus longicornis]|uniref:uncharacterized protein LOC129614422 n=1 Tax=Condylostylus longicornis TaxID=2530218 RepID=UPI00244E3820|nr:uncharacterized protein LOC129614422 [Condylostylus longicornis]
MKISPSNFCQTNPPAMFQVNDTTKHFESLQVNGRKIFNLAEKWDGPPPSNACELFIKRIPKHFNENFLLPHFQRFGKIYEFRLMMDFNEFNRGYGFVKYANEEDAAKALEVMNHFLIQPHKTLEVQRSLDKCRLFVSNIPKELSEQELEYEFRQMFPKIERVITHKRISDMNQNRGFLFLDFPNHEEALIVKKQTTPGRLRKWGRDLKIVWANPEHVTNPELLENIKSLFIRNVDLSVKNNELYAVLMLYVKRTEIVKISRVREFAFIEFTSRDAAEKILHHVNGQLLKGYSLVVEWALPSNSKLKSHDFDAVLRLKCISNYWSIPIIIFGRAFTSHFLQYVAIIIKEKNISRVFFMEINTKELTDIQSRACEVVVGLIEKAGELPKCNFVLKVYSDSAYIVGFITNLEKVLFVKAYNILTDLFLYWNEIKDLSVAANNLCYHDENQIISLYNTTLSYERILPISLSLQNRIFGCIDPLYRKKPPLRHNLNNVQIILCLIHITSRNNTVFPYEDVLYNFIDTGDENKNVSIQYSGISLLPQNLIETQKDEIIKFVIFSPTAEKLYN